LISLRFAMTLARMHECEVDMDASSWALEGSTDVADYTDMAVDAPTVICTDKGQITWANSAWVELCGFSRAADVIGRNLKCIQGPGTDQRALAELKRNISETQPAIAIELINYQYDTRRPFKHSISIQPLAPPSGTRPKLFRATSSNVHWLGAKRQKSVGEHERDERGLSRCFIPADDYGFANIGFHPPPSKICKTLGTLVDGPVTVVTQAEPPYAALWASAGWLKLCGLSSAELTGRSLRLIQGPGTDRKALAHLMDHVRRSEPVQGVKLINYHKSRRPFSHEISIAPFTTPSGARIFCTTSSAICQYGGPPPCSHEEEDDPMVWGEELEEFSSDWGTLHMSGSS